jgi:hypothetical protein
VIIVSPKHIPLFGARPDEARFLVRCRKWEYTRGAGPAARILDPKPEGHRQRDSRYEAGGRGCSVWLRGWGAPRPRFHRSSFAGERSGDRVPPTPRGRSARDTTVSAKTQPTRELLSKGYSELGTVWTRWRWTKEATTAAVRVAPEVSERGPAIGLDTQTRIARPRHSSPPGSRTLAASASRSAGAPLKSCAGREPKQPAEDRGEQHKPHQRDV